MREVCEALRRRMSRGTGRRLSLLGATVVLLLGAGVQLAGIGTVGATSSFTWSGAGSAPTWNIGTNWAGTAPTGTVGTLTFPDLPACDPTPSTTCYRTTDNVASLSASGLDFTAPKGSYTIGGTDPLAIGTSGITVTPPVSTFSFEDLSLPLTLSAPQTWSITGPAELSSAGGITGGTSSLTVDLQPQSSTSPGATLDLTGTNEVGTFTATGPALASHELPNQNGTLDLNGGGGAVGDLNGTNGHAVGLTNVALSGAGAAATPAKVGALSTTHAEVQVLQTGSPGVLSATSATFDPASVLQMEITGATSSELTSAGAVTLGTVALTTEVTGTCPSAGASYTLVSAATVSGLVSAQSSSGTGTVPVAAGGSVSLAPCSAVALKIHYSTTAVTGTVVRATTTTLTAPSGGATVDFGTSETYTATVVPATGTGTPAGTVTFSAAPIGPSGPGPSTTLCTATLSTVSGTQTATCRTTKAPVGSDTITAAYSPASTTTTFAGSSGTGFETVQYTTSATVTVNGAASGSAPAGGLVAYHVVVSNTSTGATADPTGSVMVQATPAPGTGSFAVPVCTAALFPAGTGASTASCTASDAPAGTDKVTATYLGGADFAGSHSVAATLDATGGPTTFETFSTSAGTTAVHADQSITYSASVSATASGSTGAPSGTVIVLGGFTATLPLCTITLAPGPGTTASGSCTSTVVPMAPDPTVPVTGVYSGDTTYAGSAGEVRLTMPSGAATAGLQVSASPSPTTSGTTVTYGVTMVSNDPGTLSPPTPTGTVGFTAGSTHLCTVTSLTSAGPGRPATGSCTSPAAPAGEDTVTAVYSGDTTYGGAAAVAPLTVTGTSTSTTVTVDSKSSARVGDGASVSYAATVSSTGTTPAGTVTFLVGSATLCTATLSSGTGSCASSGAPTGSDTVTARYSGGGADEASSGTASLFVTGTTPSTTSVTVTGSPAAAVATGATVTYAATVNGAGATPTGTVTFGVGTTTLCTAALSSGHAACTATNAPAGDDMVTGSYTGDATYAPSSGTASLSVTGTATSTTTVSITSSAGPYTYGEHIAYTATVTGASGTPTGTVTFSVGETTLCTGVALSAGTSATATCTTPATPVGTAETVTASYSGNATYAPGHGSTTITVAKASTTTTMTASSTTPVVGQQVTYDAIVKAPAGSGRAPTGTVAFKDGNAAVSGCTAQHLTPSATGASTASTATCTVSYAATGQHSITASYPGSTDFGASASSPALTVTVGPRTSPPPPTTPPPAPSTSTDVSTGSSSSSTGSTGTVESTNPTTGVVVQANATGEGAVTVSQLTSTPKPPPSTLTVGSLIDVEVSSGSSFSKLTEKVCGPKVGTAITWYDTSTGTWETLKPTSGPTLSAGTPPCVSFSLSSTSSPTISQLTGTAFAVGTSVPPPAPPVVRVTGETADATAAAELTRAFPYASGACPASRAAVVATTTTYQDALSSQLLARSLTTGTLLTPTESLSSVTAATLKNEGITTVYVVGGPLAVTTTVVKAIEAMTAYGCGATSPSGKITVTRIYGQTAYATAEAVATHVGSAPTKSFPGAYATTNAAGGTGRYNDTAGTGSQAPAGSVPTAILVSGQEFQDGQAASVIAYRTKLPLLLTPATTLSSTAVSAIEKLGIKQVLLVGGPLAVTNTVEAALVSATGVSVVRVAGHDATDTARELARFEVAGTTAGLGWTPDHRVMVARATFFTDGLAGAVLDSPHNSATGTSSSARPLLLTESPTVVGSSLTTFLKVTGHTGIDGVTAKTITGLTVLGGTLAVSTATVKAMQTDLGH